MLALVGGIDNYITALHRSLKGDCDCSGRDTPFLRVVAAVVQEHAIVGDRQYVA
jgi:hypothetical protein